MTISNEEYREFMLPYRKARQKARRQRPEIKLRNKELARIRSKIPEVRAKRLARNKTPERMAYIYNRRKNKLQTNSKFRLSNNLRQNFSHNMSLYSKTGKVQCSKAYGIDYNKIITFLQPTIEKIKYNHVDHIIPVSHFDLNNEFDIRICFSAENLQWLPAQENYNKHNIIREQDINELRRRVVEEESLDISILNALLCKGISKQINVVCK